MAQTLDESTPWNGSSRDDRDSQLQWLRRSEERFRSLVQHSRDVIAVLDETATFTYVSPAAERVSGHNLHEMIGVSAFDFIHPEDLDRARAKLEKLLSADDVEMTDEFRAWRKDGSLIWIEVRAVNRLRDPSVRGIVLNYNDITERKDREQSHELLEDQLRQAQKMEAVGRLAGGVAHDFNNLVAVILNYASFLQEGLKEHDERYQDAEEIRRAAERAGTLVRQLLTFSSRNIVSADVLDVSEVVSDVAKMLRRVLGEDLELSVSGGSSIPFIEADPGQIEQILLNLAVNAREAMPTGGTLIVETSSIEFDEGFCPSGTELSSGHYAAIRVSDSGCGMSEDVCSRVFEPFYTTKSRDENTGLGLATVYGIVRQLHGHISVYSEPGIGTTFNVYLPATAKTVGPRASSAVHPAMGYGETVLVAEDEEGIRRLVERILTRGGYRVIAFASGADAQEYAASTGGIDVLLTDVVMPKMSGRELANNLPEVKTIFMSGYPESFISNHGVFEAVENYLQKPFTATALLAKVRAVLDASAPAPAARD